MASDDVERTAQQLRLAIGQLVRGLRAETRGEAGLPVAQAAVLGWLDRAGPMTTSELAAAQAVRHQSTSRVVTQLSALGMVSLAAHPDDGRKILVTVSPDGRQALHRQRGQRVEWLADVISAKLSPAEQRALAKAAPLLLRLVEPPTRAR